MKLKKGVEGSVGAGGKGLKVFFPCGLGDD